MTDTGDRVASIPEEPSGGLQPVAGILTDVADELAALALEHRLSSQDDYGQMTPADTAYVLALTEASEMLRGRAGSDG